MSKHYGFHCKTCGDSSPHWVNHGATILSDLAAAWPLIERLRGTEAAKWMTIEPMFNTGDEPGIFQWLAVHGQHELELADEYGGRAPLCPTIPKGNPMRKQIDLAIRLRVEGDHEPAATSFESRAEIWIRNVLERGRMQASSELQLQVLRIKEADTEPGDE